MAASLTTLRPEFRQFASAFVGVLERVLGVRVIVTSVARSRTKQVSIWQRCMAGASRFPAAYPGTSPHELGIAFDVQIVPPGPSVVIDGRKIGQNYAIAGEIWERLGLRWGGRFRDEIHFDFYPTGFTPPGHPRSCRP